jgi:hypothetical protein
MKDIDQSHGERIIRKNGIKFYGHIYDHPALKEWVGFPVIIKGYGYSAIDVFLIERKRKGWGKGKHLCMITLPRLQHLG